MPHRIDIDGIAKNLFLLRNLAFASQSLCRTYRIDRCQDPDEPFGWQHYLGWLKSSVSEMLIEVAIKIRIVEDFLKQEDYGAIDFPALAEKASKGLVLARDLPSLEAVPLRECCNRVIHALEVSLQWLDARDDDGEYEYWNGEIVLDGTRGSKNWSCEFYVVEFTEALDHLLSILAENVDWYHVYKYDD